MLKRSTYWSQIPSSPSKYEHKKFSSSDDVETRTFNHGKAEILKIGGGEVGRLVLQKGWSGMEEGIKDSFDRLEELLDYARK